MLLIRLETGVKTRKRPNWERRTSDVYYRLQLSRTGLQRVKRTLAEQAAWGNSIGCPLTNEMSHGCSLAERTYSTWTRAWESFISTLTRTKHVSTRKLLSCKILQWCWGSTVRGERI